MKVQDWIFSIRYWTHTVGSTIQRYAVVGPGRASTVAASPTGVPEDVRKQIRANDVVHDFVEGRLDPDKTGYYATSFPYAVDAHATTSSAMFIGWVQEILPR